MNISYIREYAEKHLTEKRRVHTRGVVSEAVRLAGKYGADPQKAEIAALCHDLYRSVGKKELNVMADRLGLDPARYHNNPSLAHGKIAAAVIQEDLGINDPDIINAVSYHTTGRPGMSQLEKVVFVADAIEPGRDFPGVDRLRAAADRDIDEACLISLEGTAKHVLEQGDYCDPDTLDARDYFVQLLKEKRDGQQTAGSGNSQSIK